MSKSMIPAISILAAGLLAGCGKEDDHKHGKTDAHGAKGEAVAVPAHYKDAVEKCEQLSLKIGELIAAGKLSDVHAPAEGIKKIAEKMPEMAQKDLPADMLKDVNVNSKELAGMFHQIDDAADSGKKEETVKLHEKMKGLIAELKKHAGHKEHK